MRCETAVRTVGRIGLVTVRLSNPVAVPRRVRVANRLDGPVCPPRRDGVAEHGWDRDGVTVRVDGDGRRTLGYACPLADEPVTPAATVTDTERADEAPPDSERRRVRTAVHRLGRPEPPRDAVPAGTTEPATPAAEAARSDGDASGGLTETDSRGGRRVGSSASVDDDRRASPPAVPAATGEWLERVRRRVDAAEALTDPEPAVAADALAAVVDLPTPEGASPLEQRPPGDAVETLAAWVGDDAAALRSLAERVERLAGRAGTADPSVAAVRTLTGRARER